jgi:hypothetical protein
MNQRPPATAHFRHERSTLTITCKLGTTGVTTGGGIWRGYLSNVDNIAMHVPQPMSPRGRLRTPGDTGRVSELIPNGS